MPAAPATNEESLISRVLSQGFSRLRFPEPLEGAFRIEHRAAVLRWVRMSILVAVGTSVGFAMIDPWVIHANSVVPGYVRYGLQLPVLVIVLLSTNRRFYNSWFELAMQIGGPLFGLGTIVMASYAQPEHQALVGARTLLVAFFFYFMSGLRMPLALRGNLIILGMLIGAGIVGLLPPDVATYLSFALLCANVIGAAGAYALEHANRTSFLERKLLVEVAELDGLTRLLNRQTFESRVREEWRRAMTEQQSLTVIMVDVDHFKPYNDHYGHQAGDDCLRRVASTVRSTICSRPGDLVARYGGEEIIAVLIGRTSADAQEIAQRIVQDVDALQIPHATSADSRHVSVSVGAATQFAPFTSSYDALVKLADSALYTAKRQGRNRCIVVEARAFAAA